VRVLDEIPDLSLDFVLVDGIYRNFGALRSIAKIKPCGLIVDDNVNCFLPSRSRSPNSRTEPADAICQQFADLREIGAGFGCHRPVDPVQAMKSIWVRKTQWFYGPAAPPENPATRVTDFTYRTPPQEVDLGLRVFTHAGDCLAHRGWLSSTWSQPIQGRQRRAALGWTRRVRDCGPVEGS
jgi:hypothetical protein